MPEATPALGAPRVPGAKQERVAAASPMMALTFAADVQPVLFDNCSP